MLCTVLGDNSILADTLNWVLTQIHKFDVILVEDFVEIL